MFISYDPESGAAYISLVPEDAGFIPRSAITLEEVEALGEAAGEIVLDVDEEGRLVGIEILQPELLLRSETLGPPPPQLTARLARLRRARLLVSVRRSYSSRNLRIWNARTMSVTPDISAQIPAKTSSVYCLSMKN